MTDDACDTGLALGLSVDIAAGRSTSALRNPRRPVQKRQPSLTLSLSDDDDVQGAGGGDGWAVTREEGRAGGHQGVAPQPSSPAHSTVSSFSTAYAADPTSSAVKKEEAEVERAGSRRGSDDDAEGGGRKKLRLTREQSAMLEDRFKEHSTLNPKQKNALAKQLNLRPRQVEVWFQNRRARTKLKQTEVDCEFLKRCCESLTDENRRLHKELQELKSLKFAPPPPPPAVYMQFPAPTLTMCPSCKTIGRAAVVDSPSGDGGSTESFVVAAAAAPKPHFFNPFIHSATTW